MYIKSDKIVVVSRCMVIDAIIRGVPQSIKIEVTRNQNKKNLKDSCTNKTRCFIIFYDKSYCYTLSYATVTRNVFSMKLYYCKYKTKFLTFAVSW